MLIEYLPEFLRDFNEFKVLFSIMDIKEEDLQKALLSVKNNQYILSSDIKGIERYENMLNISNYPFPDDYRKNILFLKFNEKLPYTKTRFYKHLCALCGEYNFFFIILNSDYKIIVRLKNFDDAMKKEASILIYKMVPANMIIDIVYFNYHMILKYFKHKELKKYTHDELYREVIRHDRN